MKEKIDALGYVKVRASVHHQHHEESDRPAQSRRHLQSMWPEGAYGKMGERLEQALPKVPYQSSGKHTQTLL